MTATNRIYDAKARKYREVNEYEYRLRGGGWSDKDAAALGALLAAAPDGERDCGHDVATVAAGEASLMACPVDVHGFARTSTIHTESIDAAREAIKAAGYSWDAANETYSRGEFRAQIAFHESLGKRGHVRINIERIGYYVAMSATESHPEEALEYGR